MKKMRILFGFLCVFVFISCDDNYKYSNEGNIQEGLIVNSRSETWQLLTTENFDDYISIVKYKLNDPFIDEFIEKGKNKALTNIDMQRLMDLFLLGPSTNIDIIHRVNLSNEVYGYVESLNRGFSNGGPSSGGGGSSGESDCDRLLAIRNAMLAECEAYPVVVEQYCSTSVMIAWWIKSSDC